jgi:hypothetical protein
MKEEYISSTYKTVNGTGQKGHQRKQTDIKKSRNVLPVNMWAELVKGIGIRAKSSIIWTHTHTHTEAN